MIKKLAFATLLALASTASAQQAAVADLTAAGNAADRATAACKRNNAAKCLIDARSAEVSIDRALSILSPTPTPAPIPTPTDPHHEEPVGAWVPSPNLSGGPPLVAAFLVSEGLKPSWGTGVIPGIYAENEGAFRFTCGGEGALNYDDFLLYPARPGASHLHKYFGAEGVNAATTVSSLANVTASNCNNGPKVLNRSAYWMPAMLDDQGFVRNPDWIAVYYKRAKSSSPQCTPGSARFMGTCVALPNQIRFVWGWDPTKPEEPGSGMSWYCTTGTKQHYKELDAVFSSGCVAGSTLVADIAFPNCWNGTHLDAPDHRSHVAFGSYGSWGYYRCPPTHPYVIPQTENKYAWTVTADMIGTGADGTKFSRVRLSSDAMKTGAKPGETLHGDYAEQWVEEAKRMWHEGCIGKGLDCSGGDLGNGLQLIGASQPAYGWVNPNPRTPVPPRPDPVM